MGELVSSSDEGVVVPKPGCSSSSECSESEESDSDIGMPGAHRFGHRQSECVEDISHPAERL